MLPLPAPIAGGSLSELRRFINVADENYPLVTAWLVTSTPPIRPSPVLCLYGEAAPARVRKRDSCVS